MKTRKLFIFSAPSGSGKTTIVRHLLEHNTDLSFSISATTRPKRGTEINGEDYYFLDTETFKKKIAKGEFAEYQEVYKDVFYGTLKSEVERILNNNQHCLLDIDVIGGVNLKKEYGDKACSVFVKPPSIAALEKRLKARKTDSEESIMKRVAKAEQELVYEQYADITLINTKLEVAFKDAQKIIDGL